MTDGLFLMGTDRGVGKTIIGVAIVAVLREMGIDATLMTPVSTGGSMESATALLKQVGVEEPRHLTNPVFYETLAAPYVAAQVEERPVDIDSIHDAYQELHNQGKFVVVEGSGVMVPLERNYKMIDLLGDLALPSVIIGRSGRGTLNHCLLSLRMMLVTGQHPLGFILNGYGQYGEGFAESINPDALAEIAAPTPVLATLEWRPEYQSSLPAFIRAIKQQPALMEVLARLVAEEEAA